MILVCVENMAPVGASKLLLGSSLVFFSAIAFAFLLLDERLKLAQLAGTVLVQIGVVVRTWLKITFR
jgi:drug/metabolite transporter (DMT)-like permease